MSFIRYQPLGSIRRFHNDVDRLFSHQRSSDDWSPVVDIAETDDAFLLQADLPGVDPENIEITLDQGILTISGNRELSRPDEAKMRRGERIEGKFSRRFTLPELVDADSIDARSNHGVLEVTIGKQAKLTPRRIDVKAA